MSYFYFHGITPPSKCIQCSHGWIIKSPFYICENCNLILFCIHNQNPTDDQLQPWHSLRKMFTMFPLEKGVVVGAKQGELVLYLLNLFLWAKIDCLDFFEKSLSEKETITSQMIKTALKRSHNRGRLINTDPIDYSKKLLNNSLDYVFFNKKISLGKLKSLMNLYKLKLNPNGFYMGLYTKTEEFDKFLEEKVPGHSIFEEKIWYKCRSKHKFWFLPKSYLYIAQRQFKHDEADNALQVLKKVSDDNIDTYLLKSEIFFRLGKYKESKEELQLAEKTDHNLSPMHKQKAFLEASQNRFEKAKEHIQKALHYNLDFSSYALLFDTCRKLNQLDEASKTLDEMFLKFRTFTQLYYLKGSLEQDKKNHNEAHLWYQKGLKESTNLKINPSLINTIAMVKVGNKHGPSYVNNLVKSASRFSSINLKFICLTDDPKGLNPDIKIIDISNSELLGWWKKLLLFHYDLHKINGPFLYLDLDLVITDWIDPFLMVDEKFVTVQELFNMAYNSSMMLIDAKKTKDVYEQFQPPFSENYHGDQDWIMERIQNTKIFPKSWYKCYKRNIALYPPVGTRIVNLTGPTLKPHLLAAPWLKRYWVNS